MMTILITVLYNYMDITDALNLQDSEDFMFLPSNTKFEKIKIYIRIYLIYEKSPNIDIQLNFYN